MLFKIKKIAYKAAIKFSPILSRLFPQWLKNSLRAVIKAPEEHSQRQPYEQNAYSEGVNLFGYLKAQMGLGQGVRLYAKALQQSGLPHTLLNITLGNIAKHNDNEFEETFSASPVYNTNIIHVNAEQLPLLRLVYPASAWDKRYNICVWLWELEEFPEEWVGAFKYADEIWTPSNFTTQAVKSKSPVPVATVPYGIYADIDPLYNRAHFQLPDDKFLYLCMYDVNSMPARKNPLGAIDAFFAAFGRDSKDAGLVIKINNSNVQELTKIKSYIGQCKNVFLLDKVMSKIEVNSLIKSCDAYVSLHRSEGFGLVMAEAMYLGVPVIATNWSSNTDFMKNDNSCLVDYDFIDVEYNYYKSKPGQRWADPKIDHAAAYMQKLLSDTQYRSQIAKAGQDYIQTHYSLEHSAQKIIGRLAEIGTVSYKT